MALPHNQAALASGSAQQVGLNNKGMSSWQVLKISINYNIGVKMHSKCLEKPSQ